MAQIVILAPLFIFCYFMRKWETQDLVPIRPMEGEELPCNQVRLVVLETVLLNTSGRHSYEGQANRLEGL